MVEILGTTSEDSDGQDEGYTPLTNEQAMSHGHRQIHIDHLYKQIRSTQRKQRRKRAAIMKKGKQNVSLEGRIPRGNEPSSSSGATARERAVVRSRKPDGPGFKWMGGKRRSGVQSRRVSVKRVGSGRELKILRNRKTNGRRNGRG